MADQAKLKVLRGLLVITFRAAERASTAAWKAHRDAYQALRAMEELKPTIASDRLRTALRDEVEQLERDAAAAENASYDRRSRVSELLDLLGVDR